jgi:uncharacterized protein with PQ loop repeat
MYFKHHSPAKTNGMFFLISILILAAFGAALYLLVYIIQDSYITSMIAMSVAIVGFIPGIINIINIFKSSDYKKISQLYCIAGVINASSWFLYGLKGTNYEDPSMYALMQLV